MKSKNGGTTEMNASANRCAQWPTTKTLTYRYSQSLHVRILYVLGRAQNCLVLSQLFANAKHAVDSEQTQSKCDETGNIPEYSAELRSNINS